MMSSHLVLTVVWFHIYVVDLGGLLAKELQTAAKITTDWEKGEMRPSDRNQNKKKWR